MDSKDKIISKFNKSIFDLLKKLQDRNPKEYLIDSLINKCKVARSISHSILIDEIGKYFIKYDDILLSKNFLNFKESEMQAEVDRKEKKGKADKEDVKMAMDLFVIIKNTYVELLKDDNPKILLKQIDIKGLSQDEIIEKQLNMNNTDLLYICQQLDNLRMLNLEYRSVKLNENTNDDESS